LWRDRTITELPDSDRAVGTRSEQPLVLFIDFGNEAVLDPTGFAERRHVPYSSDSIRRCRCERFTAAVQSSDPAIVRQAPILLPTTASQQSHLPIPGAHDKDSANE
jgi:hypothetical protein